MGLTDTNLPLLIVISIHYRSPFGKPCRRAVVKFPRPGY